VSAPARGTSVDDSWDAFLQRKIGNSVPFGCCAVDGALAFVFAFEFVDSVLLGANFVQG
jgi:hypothetical protein